MSNTATVTNPAVDLASAEKKAPAYLGKSQQVKRLLSILDAARLTKQNVLIAGPPGVGKTSIIRAYAEAHDLPLAVLIGSTLDPSEVVGLPVLRPSPSGEYMVTDNTMPEWADMLMRAGRGILFLDEFFNTTPTVQAALLTLIQDKQVGQTTLPDDILIVAAGNPGDQGADAWTLAPPTANRFLHLEYHGDIEDWLEGMLVGFGRDQQTDKFGNPDMTETEREHRSYVTGFVKNHPKLWNALPMNGESVDDVKAGGAWPSPRSWDNACQVLGRITDPSTSKIVMRGYVGDEAANAYETWRASIRLPDYETVMAAPERLNWKGYKADEVYLIVNMVESRSTPENVGKTLNVFVAAAEGNRSDIGAAPFRSLLRKIGYWAADQKDQAAFRAQTIKAITLYGEELHTAGITN